MRSAFEPFAHANPALLVSLRDNDRLRSRACGPSARDQSALVSAGIPVVEVTPSKISGLYDVRLSDGATLLTDRTGTFFVVGDVYQRVNQRIVNLSDQRRMEDRKALLLALDESEMVVFDSIAERKASITVFTDIDCGFCRKLHQEVPPKSDGSRGPLSAYPSWRGV